MLLRMRRISDRGFSLRNRGPESAAHRYIALRRARDAPVRIFMFIHSWPGPFDLEIDCVAAI